MGHSHHHHHHHHHAIGAEGGERRLLVSILLNVLIAAGQFVAGIISGSLALLSDALHNASDASSLGVSYGARRISRREASSSKTFGYRRAEVLGALINLVVLVLVAGYLALEAVERLFAPRPVDGALMGWVALASVVVNAGVAVLLFRDAQESLNIRSAFLHIVTDMVSSLAVAIGGVMIVFFGMYWLDPVLTLGIAAYIFYHSYDMLRETVDILMESPPQDLNIERLIDDVEHLPGVDEFHHVHVWRLDDRRTALEGHVVIHPADLDEMEAIKRDVKSLLEEQYGIGHSTLEFEFEPCDDAAHPKCYAPSISQNVHEHLGHGNDAAGHDAHQHHHAPHRHS